MVQPAQVLGQSVIKRGPGFKGCCVPQLPFGRCEHFDTINSIGCHNTSDYIFGKLAIYFLGRNHLMSPRLKYTLIALAGLALGACQSPDTLAPTMKVFRISGRIIGQKGIDVSGTEIRINAITAIADSNGQYLFTNLLDNTYTLTPRRQGLSFTPVSIVVHIDEKDVTSQNFIAADQASNDSSPRGMRTVVGGSFIMGSNNDDPEERPAHIVTVETFAINKYEVTQKQWRELMGTNPSQFVGDDRPVERVSWYDAVEYCNALSLSEGLTPAYSIAGVNTTCNFNANGYRLPTEAEWEYACRAGTVTDYYSGSRTELIGSCYAEPQLASVGWYCNNSSGTTHLVGQKLPNNLGLFDMHGNVFEWCWDWRGDYAMISQIGPIGPPIGSLKICRGGSWFYVPQQSRSAFRLAYQPNSQYSGVGFRIVRTIR